LLSGCANQPARDACVDALIALVSKEAAYASVWTRIRDRCFTKPYKSSALLHEESAHADALDKQRGDQVWELAGQLFGRAKDAPAQRQTPGAPPPLMVPQAAADAQTQQQQQAQAQQAQRQQQQAAAGDAPDEKAAERLDAAAQAAVAAAENVPDDLLDLVSEVRALLRRSACRFL
jgi:hypothetical protein